MKKHIKNAVILTITSFFLLSCDFPKTIFCDHSYTVKFVSPTCISKGYTIYTCTKCNYTYKDDIKQALGHSYVHHEDRPATLEKEGCIEHYSCTRCDTMFDKDKNVIDSNTVYIGVGFENYIDSTEPVYVMHGKTDISYVKETFEDLLFNLEDVTSRVKNSTANLNEISDVSNDANNYSYKLVNDIYISDVLANATATTQAYELATEIYNSYYELAHANYLFYAALYRSKTYRVYLFGNHPDSYFDSYAEYYEKLANPTESELQIQMNGILNQYKTGKLQAYDALSLFVGAANDYASVYEYSDYLNYAYTNIYGREYTIQDTNSMKDFMNDYIVPLYSSIYKKRNDLVYLTLTNSAISDAYIESEKLDSEFFGRQYNYLKDYSEYLGNVYKTSFDHFFSDGSYYFSNIQNNNITGYVNTFVDGEPYMFLGRNYQTVSTFIHEFGHYNATFSYGGLNSYDLAETQSQGNEMLYYSYLIDNYLSEYTGKFFIVGQILSMLNTIIYGYSINEVEKYVYANENFTETELLNEWYEVGNSIGLDFHGLENYLYAVLLNYNGYYISYAMSAIASLEILALGRQDMDSAKDAYISIFTKDGKSETFSKSLENAGLYGVFDEDAYKLITNISSIFA